MNYVFTLARYHSDNISRSDLRAIRFFDRTKISILSTLILLTEREHLFENDLRSHKGKLLMATLIFSYVLKNVFDMY